MVDCKPKFAILGAAGFVCPRHLQAISDVGGELLAALDPHDSVGILDRYAPKCAFFTEPERFWRWMARRDFEGEPKPDWVSICSPNWLHDAHMRMALREGCKVILEKPAVLTVRNLDCILDQYPEAVDRVFVMHQLRWHPNAAEFEEWVDDVLFNDPHHRFHVDITYHTPRGPWYRHSWKGDEERSGGAISNLGIHFLDLVVDLFGKAEAIDIEHSDSGRVSGWVSSVRAAVHFSLSTAFEDSDNGKPIRKFEIDGEKSWNFDRNFTGLHSRVYLDAMKGVGVKLPEVREAVRLAEEIRKAGAS